MLDPAQSNSTPRRLVNKMGPREDRMAVVDSEFRVHGTRNLRVVDASIFPKIPRYFVVLPIYIISEKASDVILRSAGRHCLKTSPSCT